MNKDYESWYTQLVTMWVLLRIAMLQGDESEVLSMISQIDEFVAGGVVE